MPANVDELDPIIVASLLLLIVLSLPPITTDLSELTLVSVMSLFSPPIIVEY